MKKLIEIENVGTIEANQSILTGHFAFNFNGKPMRQLSKKEYEYPSENGKESVNIVLQGNIFKGMSFLLKDKVYKISEPVQWYIFAFALLPFLISLVLGNMPSLAKEGFYYVGGMIGGAISGLFSGLALFFSTYTSKFWIRVLICLACLIITFGICLGIGNAIVSAATK